MRGLDQLLAVDHTLQQLAEALDEAAPASWGHKAAFALGLGSSLAGIGYGANKAFNPSDLKVPARVAKATPGVAATSSATSGVATPSSASTSTPEKGGASPTNKIIRPEFQAHLDKLTKIARAVKGMGAADPARAKAEKAALDDIRELERRHTEMSSAELEGLGKVKDLFGKPLRVR